MPRPSAEDDTVLLYMKQRKLNYFQKQLQLHQLGN